MQCWLRFIWHDEILLLIVLRPNISSFGPLLVQHIEQYTPNL